jgi:hypothetical protein
MMSSCSGRNESYPKTERRMDVAFDGAFVVIVP